ncbi:hypothetical protein [Nocardioides sp. CFH 31398]|uniref:hypothetical protein n=1 Tax=Nocardioides sp. CFH 31398 TaxID=2919579 RepID=UPI001F053AEE|nr:hypothetical protein [Nocardioides sp. CFH 31398]MCH1868202.1 hypothetical protein [Nocardioides sp. CFH 31398]
MKLDDLMRDAVAPVEIDVHDLARTARARGTVRRRQRRLATVLAGAGAAAAVTGVALVLPTTGGGSAPSAPTVASEPTASPAAEARLDGRSTVAVLVDLLNQVGAEGVTDTYGGQGASGGSPDTYGDLHLTPPGEGLGEVGVNVQGADMLGLVGERCAGYMADCSVRTLPDGDVLRVYSDTGDGPGERRVAELLSERRGLRVVVAATNGLDLPSSRWDVTRDGTVLDDDQLVAIATDSVWGFRVPGEYAEQGAALAPYTDYDADVWAEPSTDPTQGPDGAQPSADPSE